MFHGFGNRRHCRSDWKGGAFAKKRFRRVMNGRRSYGEAYPLPRFRASVLQRNPNARQGQDAQPGVSVQRISNVLLRKPVLFWRIAGTTPFLFHPGHGEWQEKGWAWEKRRKHPFGGLQILEGASVPGMRALCQRRCFVRRTGYGCVFKPLVAGLSISVPSFVKREP